MVDFFTVPPVFVSVYLNRSWLGKNAGNSPAAPPGGRYRRSQGPQIKIKAKNVSIY